MRIRHTLSSLVALTVLIGCGTSSMPNNTSNEPLAVINGIEIPASIPTCAQSQVPGVSSTSISFTWTAVPEATRYALVVKKAAEGATEFESVFEGFQEGLSYTLPEKVSKTSYSFNAYAMKGDEPICVLDGMNGVTAS